MRRRHECAFSAELQVRQDGEEWELELSYKSCVCQEGGKKTGPGWWVPQSRRWTKSRCPKSGPVVSLGNVKGAANKPQHPRSQVSLVSRVPPSLHLPTRISCTTVRDLAEVSTAYVYHCPVGNRILFPISSYLASLKLRIIVTWAFGWGLWNLVFSKEVVFKNIWPWPQ